MITKARGLLASGARSPTTSRSVTGEPARHRHTPIKFEDPVSRHSGLAGATKSTSSARSPRLCDRDVQRGPPPDVFRDWAPRTNSRAARLWGQRVSRIITVRTGDAGDGWLCPMSSYPHDV